MADLITLALYVLATARMVQLVINDELVRGPRRWWLRHAPPGSLRRYWITCAWCVSVAAALWPAGAYVLARDHPVPKVAAAVLAFSWLAVLARDGQTLLNLKVQIYSSTPAAADDETDTAGEGR